MYSLILTLIMVGNGSARGAVSIEHIDGFTSEAACLTAGNAWIAQQKSVPLSYSTLNIRAMCVKK